MSIGIDTFDKLDGVLAAKRGAGSFKIVSAQLGLGTACIGCIVYILDKWGPWGNSTKETVNTRAIRLRFAAL